MKGVLIGNFGVGNLGDEALRAYFVHAYPEVQWTILSAHPVQQDEVPRLPLGVRSFFTTPWWKTLRAFRETDVVVFGGGSLLTDAESVFACVLWAAHAACARFYKKPIYFAFQGIGPFVSRTGESWARFALKNAAFISVRDSASAARVLKLHPSVSVIESADPVLSLMRNTNGEGSRTLTCIPRRNSGPQFLARLQELMQKHHPGSVRIVSLQPDDPAESDFCAELAETITLPVQSIPVRTLDQLMEAVSGSAFVFAERYHGALAALAQGIPFEVLPQKSDDKLASLQPYQEGTNADALFGLVQKGEDALRAALCVSRKDQERKR